MVKRQGKLEKEILLLGGVALAVIVGLELYKWRRRNKNTGFDLKNYKPVYTTAIDNPSPNQEEIDRIKEEKTRTKFDNFSSAAGRPIWKTFPRRVSRPTKGRSRTIPIDWNHLDNFINLAKKQGFIESNISNSRAKQTLIGAKTKISNYFGTNRWPSDGTEGGQFPTPPGWLSCRCSTEFWGVCVFGACLNHKGLTIDL